MKTLFQTRHLDQRQRLARRTFLAALGLGLSAPLALRMSRLAVAAPDGNRPTRLFIYFVPHGIPIEHYEPGDGMSLTTGEGILAPLEPFKKYLTVMRGVSNYVQDNHAAIRSVLTGSDDLTDSVDYLVAQQLQTTAHVLGTQSYRANSPGPDDDSKLARHGAYVTPVLNPADALDELFAGLASGGPAADPASDLEADFRREAITLTEGEVEAMRAKLSGLCAEENKLSVHLESLAALKAANEGAAANLSCDTRPELPTARGMAGRDVFSAENFPDIIDGHLEAVANAFLCGSARVATLQNMYANAQLPMDFPGGPGFSQNHHDPLSHSLDGTGRANFAVCQRWFYERLADKFLAVLDTPDPLDPEHTVLDNTTILTCTEICDGNGHHSAARDQYVLSLSEERYTYLPWNLIGGGGGLFQGGRTVTMEGVDHRNILAAVAESMGVSLSSINGESVSTPSELKA